jgi:hypothetical protein
MRDPRHAGIPRTRVRGGADSSSRDFYCTAGRRTAPNRGFTIREGRCAAASDHHGATSRIWPHPSPARGASPRRRRRPGHQGLFKVDGIPAAGSETICSASLGSDAETATSTFEDADGRVLETLELGRTEPSDKFLGDCRVPHEPFRFVVRGLRRAGKPFEQRTRVMYPGEREAGSLH